MQVILIFSVIGFTPARYGNYIFPPWAQGVGWVIALASIIWIPLAAVHTLWVLPGSLIQVTYICHLLYFPTQDIANSTHVHVLACHLHKKSGCVNITGTFVQQKLKLSLRPNALDEKLNMPYYERGGKYGDRKVADISVISSSIYQPEKPPIETNF